MLHLKAAETNLKEAKYWPTKDVLTFISECDFVESLPTLARSLKLFRAICTFVVSYEGCLSKQELLKNYFAVYYEINRAL